MSEPVRPKTLLRAVNDTLRVYAASAILAFLLIFLLPSWLRWFWFTACGLLLMVSILANFVEEWRPKSRVPVGGKAVVISGGPAPFYTQTGGCGSLLYSSGLQPLVHGSLLYSSGLQPLVHGSLLYSSGLQPLVHGSNTTGPHKKH
ncbi:hypothetical protein TNCV_3994931 [Trichonephila clavipes]|nr:hypothetical protein TNCV_3994931 [Trichonephila clavipes]